MAKKKVSRTGKKGYEFDEEGSDQDATQIVTTKASEATPSTSGVKKAKKASSKRSDGIVRKTASVDDTLILPQDSGSQNRKVNPNSKMNKMTRNKKQLDQEDVAEPQSKGARVNCKTKRKGQDKDNGDVSDCKLRRQTTMEENSEDIETIFFAEGNVGNIKVETDKDEELTDIEAYADTVNVEQITNDENQTIKKTEKVTQDESVHRSENEEEEVNKDDRKRKISNDTIDDFLDAILGNNRVEKRKAPPPKRKPNTPPKSDKITDEKRKLRRKGEKEEIFDSVFMTEKKTTQKDFSSQDTSIFSNSDLDDIYNDTTKWKKNKRSPRTMGLAITTESINTMIMDDNEKYHQLFKTGKMKKKTR